VLRRVDVGVMIVGLVGATGAVMTRPVTFTRFSIAGRS
jgi:hypothetical protein